MRLFTSGMGGFLSDQSADEVAERLAREGIELDRDTVDLRLSYLVEHGNLARSPRETEARSVREYLSNRARYQLTPRGELVHRHVEELLSHTEGAREVSSEMLAGILDGIEELARLGGVGLELAEPREVAGRITTLFAQFEVLVASTRQFYAYLTQVLTRFDLGRDEFVMFKSALIDYLQRFVDEISRHMPQVADRLIELEPHVPDLCARANAGGRLVGLDGEKARRATGLEVADWESLSMSAQCPQTLPRSLAALGEGWRKLNVRLTCDFTLTRAHSRGGCEVGGEPDTALITQRSHNQFLLLQM